MSSSVSLDNLEHQFCSVSLPNFSSSSSSSSSSKYRTICGKRKRDEENSYNKKRNTIPKYETHQAVTKALTEIVNEQSSTIRERSEGTMDASNITNLVVQLLGDFGGLHLEE